MSFKNYPVAGTVLCDMHDGLRMDRIDEIFGCPTMITDCTRLDIPECSKLIEQILRQQFEDGKASTISYTNKMLVILDYPCGLSGGVTLGYSYDNRFIEFYRCKAQ